MMMMIMMIHNYYIFIQISRLYKNETFLQTSVNSVRPHGECYGFQIRTNSITPDISHNTVWLLEFSDILNGLVNLYLYFFVYSKVHR